MGIRVNTNVDAITAMRNLGTTDVKFRRGVERLSSGLRINKAADDAAGLSISEKLRAQVRGTAQGSRNAQDGISMIQTAEGALSEMHAMLQRMRELAVQSASDTLVLEDRTAIQSEVAQLVAEIDATTTRTQFNKQTLLDGSLATLGTTQFQIGPNESDAFVVATFFVAADSAALGVDVVDLGVDSPTSAAAITTIDDSINLLSSIRADLGAVQNRLQHAVNNLDAANENLVAAESRIRDADVAMESVAFNQALILRQAGTMVLAQANAAPSSVLALLKP